MGENGCINPLNAELNPIRHLLALLGTQHVFHVSGVKVKVYNNINNQLDTTITVFINNPN